MPDQLDNIQLRSEEVQEILTRVPHWMIRWGNVLVFVLIVLLLFLSWLIKYPDVIPAEAIITTQIPPQKEYAKVTGKIEAILVKDNQIVSEDTPLAILKNTANYIDVLKLKSVVDTIKLNSKSFTFPIDALGILFLGDIETDYALFENNYSEYILYKELQPFSNEALANELSQSELKRRYKTALSQKRLNQSELGIKKTDYLRHKTLYEKGSISQQEYDNKQSEYLQARRNYESNDATLSQLKEAISNADKTSRGTEINKRKEETNLFKRTLQSFDQLKKSIRDWELKFVLKSDLNGKVSFLNFWAENQTVTAGDPVFIVIPTQHSSYLAKIKAPAQNSGKIKTGQIANIKLENYPDDEFGMLKGNVKSISLLPNKDGMYLIDVELPEKLVTTYNKEIVFKQEMSGLVEIITEDLRLIERFFYQFRSLVDK